MTATTPQVMHFENFLGPGTLCGARADQAARTPQPEKVTCERCLAMMGRNVLQGADPAGSR